MKRLAKPKTPHWRFRLEAAIANANPARIVIAEGKVRTYNIGGKDPTLDVAKAVAN